MRSEQRLLHVACATVRSREMDQLMSAQGVRHDQRIEIAVQSFAGSLCGDVLEHLLSLRFRQPLTGNHVVNQRSVVLLGEARIELVRSATPSRPRRDAGNPATACPKRRLPSPSTSHDDDLIPVAPDTGLPAGGGEQFGSITSDR